MVTGVDGRRDDETEEVMSEEEALRTTRVGVDDEEDTGPAKDTAVDDEDALDNDDA